MKLNKKLYSLFLIPNIGINIYLFIELKMKNPHLSLPEYYKMIFYEQMPLAVCAFLLGAASLLPYIVDFINKDKD